MTRKTSRKNVEKRLKRTLGHLATNDMEEALYSVSPVIDVISKERYPNLKVGERIKAYIFDEQSTLYFISTRGRLRIPKGLHIAIVDDQNVDRPPPEVKSIRTHAAELGDYIYHNIRCAQTHDAEIHSEIIDMGREFGIGREFYSEEDGKLAPGKFIISNATILGIFLVAVASPEMKHIRLAGKIKLYDLVEVDLACLVGDLDYLQDRLGQLFPTDGTK